MLLLSSCLAGFPVRYDGGTATRDLAMWLVARGQALTVCPEVMSGLSTPREPAEIVGGTAANVLSGSARILTRSGTDVTDNFLRGAHMALGIALKNHVRAAFLKDKSPSCGAARVYDGSFTGTKITGLGVTAQLLTNNGISVFPDTSLTSHAVRSYLEPEMASELDTHSREEIIDSVTDIVAHRAKNHKSLAL